MNVDKYQMKNIYPDFHTEYRAYLLTKVWSALREQRLAVDNYRCRICNRKAEVVHHRVYPKVLGQETIDDLTSLCYECHRLYEKPSMENMEDLKKHIENKFASGKKIECPVCSVTSRRYMVRMNATYVKTLGLLLRLGRERGDLDGWFKVGQGELGKTTCHDLNHCKYSKLRYWGLIEKMTAGHNRRPYSGFWRVTQAGIDFLDGKTRIPEWVQEFRKKAVSFSDNSIDVHAAYNRQFDFDIEVLGCMAEK